MNAELLGNVLSVCLFAVALAVALVALALAAIAILFEAIAAITLIAAIAVLVLKEELVNEVCNTCNSGNSTKSDSYYLAVLRLFGFRKKTHFFDLRIIIL
jgi:hypothetical protein